MQFDVNQFFPACLEKSDDTTPSCFDEKRPLYLSGSKDFLSHYRNIIRELHSNGASGSEITHLLCSMMDVLINKLFDCILNDIDSKGTRKRHVCLSAVGGYGRGELNPFSDIDIMFLHDGSLPVLQVEDIAQKLLYFLWDMRLDVGYSVRVIADCIEMAEADGTVKTALLDLRYLNGSQELFDQLNNVLFTKIMTRSSDKFIKEKLVDMTTRREKYGSTVYLLEPNLKEGEGGLRDLQTAMWVARVKFKFSCSKELIVKGVVSEEELESYNAALDYLWRIRNELHYFSGRKNEQLTFDAQVHLAAFFGYKDSDQVLAVEDFMRDYYRHAIKVEYLVSNLVSRCVWRDEGSMKVLGYFIRRQVGEGCFVLKGELVVPDESVVQKDPTLLMKIFELSQKHGVELDVRVMGLIRKNLHLVNDKFRRNRDVNNSFMNILRAPKGVTHTLRLMHHLEFLNHFIPEMEHIYCKVQHDIYHIYTVDIHSLFAVEQAEKLISGEYRESLWFPTEIASQLVKPELFVLAVLLHDIGKGCGGNHSEKGAAMIPTIARRMGLTKECTERLEFLVRHHLLFAHIAQRRDLNDEKMVIQFARQMGTSENLMMLYLLTVADVRAVGADVWTNWKSLLFQELYEKAFSILERGDFHLEASSERVKKVIRNVADFLGSEYPVATVQAELKAMPVRLLLSGNIAMLSEYVRMLIRQDHDDIVMQIVHQEKPGYSEFTICTVDMPGLFSRITGVMAANGVNILGAQINTSRNSKVLDVLQVNAPSGQLINDEKRWQKVQGDMRLVLHGKADVAAMVEKRQRPSILTMRSTPRFPTNIEIDNEVSESYTVIDVYTHDKVGLLYLITSTLTTLGLYIGVSKISTKVDQVADVFYVRDIFGHKILEQDKLDRIKRLLCEAIDEWV